MAAPASRAVARLRRPFCPPRSSRSFPPTSASTSPTEPEERRHHPTPLRGILGEDPKAELQQFDDGLAPGARRTPFRRQHDTNDDAYRCPSALRLIHVSRWSCCLVSYGDLAPRPHRGAGRAYASGREHELSGRRPDGQG